MEYTRRAMHYPWCTQLNNVCASDSRGVRPCNLDPMYGNFCQITNDSLRYGIPREMSRALWSQQLGLMNPKIARQIDCNCRPNQAAELAGNFENRLPYLLLNPQSCPSLW